MAETLRTTVERMDGNVHVLVEPSSEILEVERGERPFAESGAYAVVGPVERMATHSPAYEFRGLVGHWRRTLPPDAVVAYIDNLAVAEGKRGKGLGSALMRRMIFEIGKHGAEHVFGHMAEWEGPERERLARWLGKFGFEVIDCCAEDRLPVVAFTLRTRVLDKRGAAV